MLIQLIYKNIHLKFHLGNNYCAPGAKRKCSINSCFSVHPPILSAFCNQFSSEFSRQFFFQNLVNDTHPDLEKTRKYQFTD